LGNRRRDKPVIHSHLTGRVRPSRGDSLRASSEPARCSHTGRILFIPRLLYPRCCPQRMAVLT
jgi:hypothetical protein